MHPDTLRVTSRRLAQAAKERTITFVLSTAISDRAGDTVNQNGWDLARYLANPVVLWGHNHSLPAIGRMTRIGVEAEGLVGDIRFADAEQHPFADTVFKLVNGDFISAGSVGFIPKKWNTRDDYSVEFLEQELIEYSVVNVPMNPDCLARAVAGGIDIAPLAKAVGANTGSYNELRAKLLASNTPKPTSTHSLDTLQRGVRAKQARLRLV